MVAGYFPSHLIYFRQEDDYQRRRKSGGLVDDEVLSVRETRSSRNLVLTPESWMTPPSQWCPKSGVTSHPQQPSRLHLATRPRLAGDGRSSGVRQCAKDAMGAEDKNSSPSRISPPAAVPGGGNQGDAPDSAGNKSISQAQGGGAWRFVVDMNGCNEASVVTEGNQLTVEGYGVTNVYHKTVRYVTRLPSHVRHDFLAAKLSKGRLTVTQKPLPQLNTENGTLSTQQQQQQQQQQKQQQKVIKVEKQQQEQEQQQ